METKVNRKTIYIPSDDVVAREIEGELLIVPLAAGVGDMEDALFTFNETGRAIWERLDGKNNLQNVVDALSLEFESTVGEIEEDVVGLVEELLKRRMLVEVPKE